MPFRQELLDTYKRFMRLAGNGSVDCLRPKAHLLGHLVVRAQAFGSPSAYSCWTDESQNEVMKRVLRNVPQSTFEASGLWKLEQTLSHSLKRQRLS